LLLSMKSPSTPILEAWPLKRSPSEVVYLTIATVADVLVVVTWVLRLQRGQNLLALSVRVGPQAVKNGSGQILDSGWPDPLKSPAGEAIPQGSKTYFALSNDQRPVFLNRSAGSS